MKKRLICLVLSAPLVLAACASPAGPSAPSTSPSSAETRTGGPVGSGAETRTGGPVGAPAWDLDYGTVKYDPAGGRSWVARYNGPGNALDRAQSIAVDEGGNAYVTGSSHGSGNGTRYDYATLKYDNSGARLWASRYSGPGYGDSMPNAIAVDKAGNVYVTGGSVGETGLLDYATVKYDSQGQEKWVARYDGFASSPEQAQAIALDDAGNVYVTGSGNEGSATIKYSSDGRQAWATHFEGGSALAMVLDNAGNVYVSGYVHGDNHDYLTVKYDAEGNRLWAGFYDGTGNSDDIAYAVAVDGAGDIIVTGRSNAEPNGNYDYATVKYDADGTQLWAARYNGPGNSGDIPNDMTVDADGHVYVTGESARDDANRDYATVKYDGDGSQLWAARYSGPENGDSVALGIALDSSGNALVTGMSGVPGLSRDYATVKYDSAGHQLWAAAYHGPGAGLDRANAVAVDGDGNVYVAGESSGQEGTSEMTQSPYPGAQVYADETAVISVKRGQELAFGFDTAFRLGLAWDEEHDEGLLALLDRQTIQGQPGGVGGKTWFLFRALKPGDTKIVFTYHHGGATPAADMKTFDVVIR